MAALPRLPPHAEHRILKRALGLPPRVQRRLFGAPPMIDGQTMASDTHVLIKLAEPGLPFSLVFRCEPGKEDVILKVASAYEAASKRRVPPPAFGPLPG